MKHYFKLFFNWIYEHSTNFLWKYKQHESAGNLGASRLKGQSCLNLKGTRESLLSTFWWLCINSITSIHKVISQPLLKTFIQLGLKGTETKGTSVKKRHPCKFLGTNTSAGKNEHIESQHSAQDFNRLIRIHVPGLMKNCHSVDYWTC